MKAKKINDTVYVWNVEVIIAKTNIMLPMKHEMIKIDT